jgi:hypothetical protein
VRAFQGPGAAEQPGEPFGEQRAEHLLALLVVRAGRVALVLGGAQRWQREPGATLIPLELPGGRLVPGVPLARAVSGIAERWLSVPAHIVPSATRYGPSARHAVDRSMSPAEPLAPEVSLTRMAPGERAESDLRPVTMHIYRAALEGPDQDVVPGPWCAGLLWLTLDALRRVVRGLPLAELLAEADAGYQPAHDRAPPDDALIYLPSEYGERYLLRVAAKYGPEAIMEAILQSSPNAKPNPAPNAKGEETDGAGI